MIGRLRATAWVLGAAIAVAGLTRCSSRGAHSAGMEVGESCVADSDCNAPLVCVRELCHEPCREPSDCAAGQTCREVGGVEVCELAGADAAPPAGDAGG